MDQSDPMLEAILTRIRNQIAEDAVLLTQHAQQEMVVEEVGLAEVYQALESGAVLENYPDHRRGACCLVGGYTLAGRALHVVCTTARAELIVITVYEPKPPKWMSPTKRGPRA
jgi:hypothetical protein